MNRTQQLKLLNEEIRRLFSDGINEQNAFDQLQADLRFDTVRRSSVQSLYKKLKNDADKQAKTKELNDQKRYQQISRNLLICEDPSIKKEDEYFEGVLKDRYVTTSHFLHGLEILEMRDLYQNMIKEISFPFEGLFIDMYPLCGQFSLFTAYKSNVSFIYLAYVDLIKGTLELVKDIKREDRKFEQAFVDSSDPSKFAIEYVSHQGVHSIAAYSLSDEKVNVGEEIVIENMGPRRHNCSYFNGQLLELKFDEGHPSDMNHANIVVLDLSSERQSKNFKLGPLPNIVCTQWMRNYTRRKWFHDHLFLSVKFRLTGLYGIVFIEPQTCTWKVMEFAIDLPIVNMTFVNNQSLLVSAGKHSTDGYHFLNEVSKVYKLPVRKPESLQNKAWFKTVEFFKKKQGVNNPYQAARKFLPLNSKIQSPFNIADRE